MDGDGRLDIVVGNVNSSNAIYFGKQAADDSHSAIAFEEMRFGDADHITYWLAIGDVSGDGLPDIVTANSDGPNMIYVNRSRRER